MVCATAMWEANAKAKAQKEHKTKANIWKIIFESRDCGHFHVADMLWEVVLHQKQVLILFITLLDQDQTDTTRVEAIDHY